MDSINRIHKSISEIHSVDDCGMNGVFILCIFTNRHDSIIFMNVHNHCLHFLSRVPLHLIHNFEVTFTLIPKNS